ncbi:proton gradient regulation 5 [Seminavis robusta]|uniref:Proton gradient regulation 5 n=1 Tax=Seminavis robusta TaxID=568900 RepID=A0A9N8H027_9STRA|nr:proton gradient regulation 5 [Seminavis robusta]|eukprot:Sro13_g009910.1 proton gradient regulation 5 (129) ;mRNA; r:62949-63335
MKSFLRLCLLAVFLVASTSAFVGPMGGATGGSSFVVSTKAAPAVRPAQRTHKSSLEMGSQAKFGVFSPAVYGAKIVLGNDKLNKIRGKAISLHSQYIGDFCQWVGAYHLRTRLVKKAKTNGDTLGFLV